MIEFRNINFRYAGGTDAGGLVNINLIIPDGQVILLCGQSGCGKTTLLRIMMGLETADEGECRGMGGLRKSAVFQEDRLCENLNVLSNIRLVQKEKTEIREGLEAVGLLDCCHQPVRQLSGGMKRRVAIVRALYAKWDILFLDEPFKGLDKEMKERVIAFLKKGCEGKTVICITHEEKEAEALGAVIQYF